MKNRKKKTLNFHNFYLDLIKQKIGASFVGWENTKEVYKIKVIRNKETFYFDIKGSPSDVTRENYLNLIQSIRE